VEGVSVHGYELTKLTSPRQTLLHAVAEGIARRLPSVNKRVAIDHCNISTPPWAGRYTA